MNVGLVILGVACIVGGVVTQIFAPEGPIAILLVTAGAGAIGKTAINFRAEAHEHAQRVDELERKDANRPSSF